jgi:hypothetical protein
MRQSRPRDLSRILSVSRVLMSLAAGLCAAAIVSALGPYPQATRRLRAALEDLKTVAPPERQASLDRQLRLLRQAVEHDLGTPDDMRAALVPDQQGLGSGVDVTVVGGDSPGSADPIADASAPRS